MITSSDSQDTYDFGKYYAIITLILLKIIIKINLKKLKLDFLIIQIKW